MTTKKPEVFVPGKNNLTKFDDTIQEVKQTEK